MTLGCQWESGSPVSVTHLTGAFPTVLKSKMNTAWGKASRKTSPFLFTVWHVSERGWTSGENHQRDSAFRPLEDGDGFFMGYPFQALPIDSDDLITPFQTPIFRGCSLQWSSRPVCLLLRKCCTTEKDLNENSNCSACARIRLSGLHGCSTAIEQWWTHTKEVFLLNDFSNEIPIWERI